VKVMMFTGAVPRMPSGVGDYVGELQKALKGKLELVIVTANAPEVDVSLMQGAKVYPVVESWGASDLAAIASIIRNEKPDIFHQQYPSYMGGPTNRGPLSNLLPPWLKWKFRGTPLITTFHEYGERRLRWRTRAFLNLRLSDAIITVTAMDKAILSKWKSKVHRVPIMSNIPAHVGARDLAKGKPRIAYFGFMEPLKGFDRFISIASLLGGDGFEYSVIGGFHPESNAYHRSLLESVKSKGLEKAFRFLGHIDGKAVAQRLAESDCCLLPFEEGVSERRGSFLAAVVQGTPVVTTEGPFTPSDFRDTPGMAMFPKDDLQGMADKVREYCRARPDTSGLERISKSVGLDPIAAAHLDVYASVLGK
jgi:glycosyltransferase involved in cell wall biosynthesis